MELEAELTGDVRVCVLLVRQADVEPDGFAPGFRGTAVRRFHDAAAAAGAHDVAMRVRRQRFRPLRDQARQGLRVMVVASHRPLRRQARGAEEHDRVLDAGLAEPVQRLQVLGQNPQRPRRIAR